jgi:peptide/nickel transport system ATP-binding protein
VSLLEVTGLRTEISGNQGRVVPVDGVTFSLDQGEVLGLVGESGSGKTMTGMSIMRLLPHGAAITSGSIRFAGRELTALDAAALRRVRGSEIALISQDPMTSLNPTRTIGSQLREAYRIHTGASYRAANVRAAEVLGLVGMPRPAERLNDFPHQLSGGMRQRAMIAIGLLCEPKLLIADEPTTALDVSIQAQILKLIDSLRERLSMAVLLITHDMGVIAGHADRVAVMYAGRIVEQADTVTLFADPRHRYTEALFESMPTLELDSAAQLAVIPGAPPKLTGAGGACRFAPRCRFAAADCGTQDPPMAGAGPGHLHACLHPRQAESAATVVTARHEAAAVAAADVPLLELREVSKQFRARSRQPFRRAGALHAVSGVSLTVFPGETLGIVGESGCGKTTMGRMMVGLERPTAGSVIFDGLDIATIRGAEFRTRRRDLQMMFQDSSAALDPRMPVSSLVAEPLAAQHVGSRGERRAAVRDLLDAVGLPADAGRRYAHEFSGGQRQRIAMARALALHPRIIIADEPVSALDVSVQAQILNLMRSLQARYGLTYVVIAHDLSLLKYLADRIGVMYLGRLVELGPSAQVYSAPRHPYTAGLIESIPMPDPAAQRAKASGGLGGELPSALNPPSGCRFRTRCPLAAERCAVETPALVASAGRHAVACHYPLASPAPVRKVQA